MSSIGIKARRAFTLIEVTVVLVVIVVLATLTVPRLQDTVRKLRAEQVVAELMHLLRAAREQAIGAQVETVWSWDEPNRRALVRQAEAESADASPAIGTISGARAPEGTEVSITREGDPVDCLCLRFFPDGTSEPATLLVQLYDHTLTATLDETTGQASLRPAAR